MRLRTRLFFFLVPLALLWSASVWLGGGVEGAERGKLGAVVNPTVAVRLEEHLGSDGVDLRLRGSWRMLRADGKVLHQGTEFEGRLAVDASGARVGAWRPRVDRFRLEADGDAAVGIADRWYRGKLDVRVLRSGTTGLPSGLDLRLELPLEDYVVGVVCGEMPTGKAEAAGALSAQAVAARTYALYRLRAGREFLRDDARDQRFLGVDFETEAARVAVRESLGQVLFWDGELLPAYYHAQCAGHTADAAALGFVKRGIAPLAGVDDPGCRDPYGWEQTVPAAHLDRLAREHELGTWVQRIEIRERGAGGRCVSARVSGDLRMQHFRGEDLRPWLDLPSTVWRDLLPTEDGSLTVRGAGRGHGVGMCQEGALRRARNGMTAEEILGHYYPGAVLRFLLEPGTAAL
ncbi:MAG TPA: SpoIID/LytB domain-containing protein [Planctomycetota bacterium]